MTLFLLVVGLLLVLEGTICALFPERLKAALKVVSTFSEDYFRWGGVFIICLGVVIIWVTRHWFVG